MKGKHLNQTLKRLAKDLASHPVLLFLAFLELLPPGWLYQSTYLS